MNFKNIISGFDVNENLSRKYDLIDHFASTWETWIDSYGKTKFDYSIPINGIVESIEKICSSNEFNRFVLIKGEVEFYRVILENHKKNFLIIEPGQWNLLENNDLICISMPFSPTASIPEWYFNLCDYINNKNIRLFIDGAYLGTINKKIYIPNNCKFFSLSVSKCFNASGLRSGILFCDQIISTFKTKFLLKNYNYYAMEKAIELLKKYNYYDCYTKHINFASEFCEKNNLTLSDSVVLGYTYKLNHELKEKMNFNSSLNIYRMPLAREYRELNSLR
jgi:histidinol-phosphate/aromatic aminotransferase/cobyric acid decarboxylase-like protein